MKIAIGVDPMPNSGNIIRTVVCGPAVPAEVDAALSGM